MILFGDVFVICGKLVLYGCNGGNELVFLVCVVFKKYL